MAGGFRCAHQQVEKLCEGHHAGHLFRIGMNETATETFPTPCCGLAIQFYTELLKKAEAFVSLQNKTYATEGKKEGTVVNDRKND